MAEVPPLRTQASLRLQQSRKQRQVQVQASIGQASILQARVVRLRLCLRLGRRLVALVLAMTATTARIRRMRGDRVVLDLQDIVTNKPGGSPLAPFAKMQRLLTTDRQ
jgi:hypothetical protein